MGDSDKKSVLIVDDEPDICVNLEAALSAEGYTTFVAHTGEKAIEIADREQVEIILLDIMMPGLDGYEVCRRLRQKASTRRSSIVFASALKKTEEKVEGLDTGADDYITKPYDYDELLAKVRALFRLREYQDQLTRLVNFSHSINKISTEDIKAGLSLRIDFRFFSSTIQTICFVFLQTTTTRMIWIR
jgi:two-component system cell cycle response regulator